jgi:hypothetical protein
MKTGGFSKVLCLRITLIAVCLAGTAVLTFKYKPDDAQEILFVAGSFGLPLLGVVFHQARRIEHLESILSGKGPESRIWQRQVELAESDRLSALKANIYGSSDQTGHHPTQ